jgi:hypothetical protein
MKTICEASGVISTNPYPADWPIHAFYPNIVNSNSGDLLCVCRHGSAMYSDDGRIVKFRSNDGGETWHNEGMVWDGSQDSQTYWYAPSGITLAATGDILLTGFRIHRPAPNIPTVNDATGACLPEETFFMRSSDAGRTWTDLVIIPKPAGVYLEAYGSILLLEDGSWLQAFDVTKAYDDPCPTKPRIVGFVSSDEGQTWSGPHPIAGSLQHARTFWHMRLIRRCNNRPIGFAWTADESGQEFLSLHRVAGSADGLTWSEPTPTGIPGQTNCPVDLGEDRLAIAYTRRGGDMPGIYVSLSKDDGHTWDLQNQVQVWDAYGRESLGVPRTATYPSSHDDIAFGAPNLIKLSDNELLASFWATIAGQTVCRWARVRIEE